MSVLIDAVRTASRTRRYAHLKRAETDSARGTWMSALFLWGVPAIAPVLALLAVATAREPGFVDVGLALVVTLLLAHVVGKPRLQAFDLLHQPSRRGLVLGHVLHRLPVLIWAGALTCTTWLVLMPWLPQRIGGACVLGALALAPIAISVHAGAGKVAARAGREETASVLPFVLPLVGWEAARLWFDGSMWGWLLPLAGAGLGVAIVVGTGDLLATVRKALAILVVLVVAALPAKPGGELPFAERSTTWDVVGGAAALVTMLLLGLALRAQLRLVDEAQVLETHAGADEGIAGGRPSPSAPIRRERAGAGLWKARLRYVADEWLPDSDERRSAAQTVSAWMGSSIVLLVTALRGPILAGLAVGLTKPDLSLVWLGVLAGCFAGRVSAVDTTELQPRLWLLGVDYRDQVLHGLRALFRFAALPTLATALAALAIAGPADPARQSMVLVIGATLLLRAGLPGLWPLQETHRLRLVLVWAGLMALAVAYEAWWTPLEALRAAAVGGAVGLVLLIVRLFRLREPHVAECVRRSAEP